jgi:hypothetical protein
MPGKGKPKKQSEKGEVSSVGATRRRSVFPANRPGGRIVSAIIAKLLPKYVEPVSMDRRMVAT